MNDEELAFFRDTKEKKTNKIMTRLKCKADLMCTKKISFVN